MPRVSGGNYSLPEAAFVSGTTILSAKVNSDLSDLANAMQDSLSRSGVGSMQAPLGLVDGSEALPGLTWNNEAGTGFRHLVANEMRAVINANDTTRWNVANFFQVSKDGGTTWLDPLLNNAPVTIVGSGWHFASALTIDAGGLTVTAGGVSITGGGTYAGTHNFTGTFQIGGVTVAAPPSTVTSSSCGNFSTASATPVAVTNLSVTLTATGTRPIAIVLIDDGGGFFGHVIAQKNSSTLVSANILCTKDAGSTFFQTQGMASGGATGNQIQRLPPGAIQFFDQPSQGSVTYKIYADCVQADTIQFNNVKLVAFEV